MTALLVVLAAVLGWLLLGCATAVVCLARHSPWIESEDEAGLTIIFWPIPVLTACWDGCCHVGAYVGRALVRVLLRITGRKL